MSNFVLLFVVLVVVVLVVGAINANAGPGSSANWPFQQRKPLSQPEQVLYYRLLEALPGHVVLPQVGLSRFLVTKKGTQKPQQWFNRISRMSVDFLVCDKAMNILAAIELDDSTHDRPSRQVADDKKNQVLAAASVRLIRWHVKSLPDVLAISAALNPKP